MVKRWISAVLLQLLSVALWLLMSGVLLLLFWSAVTLALNSQIARDMYRQWQATDYRTTQGVITYSQVKSHHGSETTTYSPKLRYDYTVGGRRFAGDRYRYGQGSSNDDAAQRIVRAHSVGRRVAVHYAPDDPSESLLLPGVQGSDLFLLLFLTPFNAVMIGGWAAWGLRRAYGKPTARYAQHPLAVFGIALGACSFLAMIPILMFHGFHPPWRTMVWVWGVVLGLAVLVGIRSAFGTGFRCGVKN